MALRLLFNGGLTAFLVYCYYHLTQTAPVSTPGEMDGADWPRLLLTITIFFLVINFVKIIRETPAAQRDLSAITSINFVGMYKSKLFLAMALLVLYGLILPQVGFVPGSFLLATLYMILLGERRVHFAVLYSAIVIVVLYSLFYYALGIMLPRGVGPFREFAIMLEMLI